ncbi:zf-TFIIB domain-containing protein [Roseovarius phycicola]|uniref:Zf-TFIIB domain-containing protein n=1 Tax=Roseovarius phycicola TaxID=3080976 RepID=A0ABZ2HIY7_9RHOB
MKCPVDGETLVISDRSGVEIDYCPQCRGVWLDRGELDKIIERSAPEPSRAPRRDARDWDEDDRPRRKKSRGGFLEDLFDF